jgi:hypothetical protein
MQARRIEMLEAFNDRDPGRGCAVHFVDDFVLLDDRRFTGSGSASTASTRFGRWIRRGLGRSRSDIQSEHLGTLAYDRHGNGRNRPAPSERSADGGPFEVPTTSA